MDKITLISNIVKDLENLGIIGILILISGIFIYLHIKEIRLVQETLKEVNTRIRDLIENQKELNEKLFTILLNRKFDNKG